MLRRMRRLQAPNLEPGDRRGKLSQLAGYARKYDVITRAPTSGNSFEQHREWSGPSWHRAATACAAAA